MHVIVDTPRGSTRSIPGTRAADGDALDVAPPRWRELEELPDALLHELEQFFVSYNRAHGRVFEALARRGSAAALRAVSAACGTGQRR